MYKRMTAALTPLIALLGFAALPAIAQATTLHEISPEERPMSLGAYVKESTNYFKFNMGGSYINCPVNEIGGTLIRNSEEIAEETAEVEIEQAVFRGSTGGECKVYGYPEIMATIDPIGLPWIQTFDSEGNSVITGSSGKVGFEIVFNIPRFPCRLEADSLVSSWAVTEPLVWSIGQSVDTSGCEFPSSVFVEGPLYVTHNGNKVFLTNP